MGSRLLCAVVLCTLVAAVCAPAGASAGTSSAVGGVVFVDTPKIAKLACVSRCALGRRAQSGSTLRISGQGLAKVTEAIFHGSTGPEDDAEAKVKRNGSSRIDVRVPGDAVSGPVSVRTVDAVDSGPIGPVDILPGPPPDVFARQSHVFPIVGEHDFGGAGAHFGSSRAGHSHQGQDVFARCGTPLVAARGGKVQFKAYHAAAGNYVVIDGAGTGNDYVYMHLASPTPFRVNDQVLTGQRIGSVGDTGNAQGCHLHFELWTAPGWYDGGRPVDPFKALVAWKSWTEAARAKRTGK